MSDFQEPDDIPWFDPAIKRVKTSNSQKLNK